MGQIVAGLHLAGPEVAGSIPLTVDFLSRQLKPRPTYIFPMHCSGLAAKVALEEAFGEGCVPTGVGNQVVVEWSPENEKLMHQVQATYSQHLDGPVNFYE